MHAFGGIYADLDLNPVRLGLKHILKDTLRQI